MKDNSFLVSCKFAHYMTATKHYGTASSYFTGHASVSAPYEHSITASHGDADLVERVEKWANDGKTVLVSALDATFQAKPFMNVLHLIPLAENVIKLTAICTGCRKEASFTKRLSSETDVEVRSRMLLL